MTFWDGAKWVREVPNTPEPARRGAARHIASAIAESALITSLVFGLIAGTAFAAHGGKGSITTPDGVYGGTTTATVNPGGSDAMALAKCYQNDTLVYAQYVQVDSANRAMFKLGPTQMWSGGSARCTAEEGAFGNGGRWRAIATTTFSVSG